MMKSSVPIVSFLCALTLLGSCTKYLEYTSNEEIEEKVVGDKVELQVSVKEPGNLRDALSGFDYRSISKLSVAGPVNGTDLKFIRLMAGADEYGNETDGSLEILDISEALLTAGGEPYFIFVDETDNTETPISLENSVLSRYAFGYCKLKEIILPDTITRFASQAFYSCQNLKTVNIPRCLESIGRSVFCNCKNLKSEITLPDGITHVPDYTFFDCANLTSIVLPESVSSLGFGCFAGCARIVSLGNLPNLSNIGECCFENCKKLKSFRIPPSITCIPANTFSGCQSLESINLSDIVEFGYKAFYKCYKLTSFTLSDKLQYIDHYAFYSSGLNMEVNLPETVKYIGEYAFCGTDITSLIINSDIRTYEDKITSPYSFGSCKQLKSVRVSDGCKILGLSFADCTALELVSLPNSLDSLGYVFDSFEYTLRDKEGVEIMYDDIGAIFRDCTSLNNISLPSNLKFISSSCFYGCTNLESIVMPDSITHIGNYVFSGCNALSNVVISKSLSVLPQGCFKDCLGLVEIILPDNIKEIDAECFAGSGIESITMSKSLIEIGIESFYGCANIREISIPSKVQIIRGGAFGDCAELNSVSFELGGELKSISSTAFYHCPMLSRMVIPEGVSSIGEYCFSISGLQEISIPHSLQEIGKGCFDRCLKLKNFLNYSEVPQIIQTDIFPNINHDNITLHVPVGSIDLYKKDSYWGTFQHIVGL